MLGGRAPRREKIAMEKMPRRWSLRSKIIGSIAVIVVLAIALGVGLGVGLTSNNSSSSPTPTPTPTTTPLPGNYTNTTTGAWWKPSVGATWQIEISYALNDTSTNALVWDIDLFENNATTISLLHGENRKVICYFSAGSYENFRPDSSEFQKSDYGSPLAGWPGEWWADTRSTNVRNIMLKRLDLAASINCDGVDPDNIDAYDNSNGLGLTQDDAVSYVTFLSDAAHGRNLSIGLKNGVDIVSRVLDIVEWEVNESCEEYNECGSYQPFITAGKPVFHIEYPKGAPDVSAAAKASVCDAPDITGFSTVLKDMDLDNWIETC